MGHNEHEYFERSLRMLEDSYVSADMREDVAGGSGSSTGLANWAAKRKPVAAAFDHHGTWLDVGCANGLLMQTLTEWTSEKGLRVEPHGLEISERIADRARLRYPQWASRIWTGNVMTWLPSIRFDYVTLLPEYVPEEMFKQMLERVCRDFLRPGGRLVVGCYFGIRPEGAPPLLSADELLHEFGFVPLGTSDARRNDGSLWTSTAWFDKTD